MLPVGRIAIVATFVPLIALYLVVTSKFQWLFPSHLSQLAISYTRHTFFPWTAKLDKLSDGLQHHRTRYTRHIVAVGDLHGDIGNARKVLRFSGVVDEDGDWTGDVDVFVQTGDIIDRGDDTILLFEWMDKLRAQANEVGDTMMSILGNHEWMNAIGDWRYVYPSEIETFGNTAARQRMITTGSIGRSWANNYTTAARLPLHPYTGPPNTPYPPSDPSTSHLEGDLSHAAVSFVHGGLSPSYSNLSPFPSKINELSDSLLFKLQNREQPPPSPPHRYPGLPHDATKEEDELYGTNGPLWYRGWAMRSEKEVCGEVDEVLRKTGTRRMIMGHTPDFQNIVSRCDGKIIIIDTGISHAYGGVLSALSIHYALSPVGQDDEKRWHETETVSAIYPDRREVIIQSEREVYGEFQDWEHL